MTVWNTIVKALMILESNALSVVNKDRPMWMEIYNLSNKFYQAARLVTVQTSKKMISEFFVYLWNTLTRLLCKVRFP